MDKELRPFLIPVVLMTIVMFLLFGALFNSPDREIDKQTYKSITDFMNFVKTDSVKAVEVSDSYLRWQLRSDSSKWFEITVGPQVRDDLSFIEKLQNNKVRVTIISPEKPSLLLSLLLSLLPMLLFLFLFVFLINRAQNSVGGTSLKNFRGSPARIGREIREKVTFEDVAGCNEAKEEVREIIDFLKGPEKFKALGGKIPRGVLLVGPPGTGKTLLARAVAGEAAVPIFITSGAEFVEMFVGVGASRVRGLFAEAAKRSPAVIFIDELDAVGRHRGAGLGGGHDEREQTLNQILVEMDGFGTDTTVIVIAATNRPDILDPALTRPGRFDRQVVVHPPDLKGREAILKIHSKNVPLAEDVNLHDVARGTPGFVGADLANLVNEAALLAARRNKKQVEQLDFEDARDKVTMGLEQPRLMSDKDKKTVAYHEAGHTIVAKALAHTDPVNKVTIIPRGRALGVTQSLPEDDRLLYSKPYLDDQIAVLMGGRLGEEILKIGVTNGASNDFERATEIARKMVCEWGMSDSLGPLAFGRSNREIFLGRDFGEVKNYSEKTAQLIDEEIKQIVMHNYFRAKAILETNMAIFDRLTDALLEKETLDAAEIGELTKGLMKVEN